MTNSYDTLDINGQRFVVVPEGKWVEAQRKRDRFEWCQNNPKEAQAMFWNYSSRKDRAKAIDQAMGRE
jgi:hypothetical protein